MGENEGQIAKTYLKRIEVTEEYIRQSQNELDAYREMASGVSGIDYSADKVQSSPKDDTMVNAVLRILKKEEEIEKKIIEWTEERSAIVQKIQKMREPRYMKVLYERYVNHKSFEEIAVMMNYEYSYIRKLHIEALVSFEKTHKITH